MIAISEFTRDELIRSGFEPERVHVAPMAIVVPEPETDAVLDARVAAAGIEAPYVLSVGTIEPRKGLDTLAAAVANVRRRHPDLTLVLAGPTGWLSVPGLDGPGGPPARPGRRSDARRALPPGDRVRAPVALRGLRAPGARGDGPGLPGDRLEHDRAPRGRRRRRRARAPGDVVGVDRRRSMDVLDDDAARADLAARGRRRAARLHLGRAPRRPTSTRTPPRGLARRARRLDPRAPAAGRLGGARPSRRCRRLHGAAGPGPRRARRARPPPARPPRRRGALGRPRAEGRDPRRGPRAPARRASSGSRSGRRRWPTASGSTSGTVRTTRCRPG